MHKIECLKCNNTENLHIISETKTDKKPDSIFLIIVFIISCILLIIGIVELVMIMTTTSRIVSDASSYLSKSFFELITLSNNEIKEILQTAVRFQIMKFCLTYSIMGFISGTIINLLRPYPIISETKIICANCGHAWYLKDKKYSSFNLNILSKK